MKLHKDGTVEGTPQEIAEYNQLTQPVNQETNPAIKAFLQEQKLKAIFPNYRRNPFTENAITKQDVPEVKRL